MGRRSEDNSQRTLEPGFSPSASLILQGFLRANWHRHGRRLVSAASVSSDAASLTSRCSSLCASYRSCSSESRDQPLVALAQDFHDRVQVRQPFARIYHSKANARVAENLYRKATGDSREGVTAAIFWLKCRVEGDQRQGSHRRSPHHLCCAGAPACRRHGRMAKAIRAAGRRARAAPILPPRSQDDLIWGACPPAGCDQPQAGGSDGWLWRSGDRHRHRRRH